MSFEPQDAQDAHSAMPQNAEPLTARMMIRSANLAATRTVQPLSIVIPVSLNARATLHITTTSMAAHRVFNDP
jgi:hypothetical protein